MESEHEPLEEEIPIRGGILSEEFSLLLGTGSASKRTPSKSNPNSTWLRFGRKMSSRLSGGWDAGGLQMVLSDNVQKIGIDRFNISAEIVVKRILRKLLDLLLDRF